MKGKILATPLVLVLAGLQEPSLLADNPIIPPTISEIWPVGMERGATATFLVDGRSLSGAKHVIFDAPGITAKIVKVTELPEKITGPRAGVDLAAQVASGKKETAQIQVTVAKDVEPGIHKFRIQTTLGTSNLAAMDIGSLPEIIADQNLAQHSSAKTQRVTLPATLPRINLGATPAKISYFRLSPRLLNRISSRCSSYAILPGKSWREPVTTTTGRMPYLFTNCLRPVSTPSKLRIEKRADRPITSIVWMPGLFRISPGSSLWA
jgi:hypothetical protein